jgi:hypothetical protein
MPQKPKASQKKPFKCECGVAFASKAAYLEHQKDHAKTRKSSQATAARRAEEKITQKGEPGQTEQERREWRHLRREDAKEKRAKRVP